MTIDFNSINIHKFIDDELEAKGFKIKLVTKELVETRIEDFMTFVNNIRTEYKEAYGWSNEPKEYFLNGLVDKWKYSFVIMNKNDEIRVLNFASVYGKNLHLHFLYAHRETRSLNLGKLHMLKMYQTGLDNGITSLECFWPKHNNGSIVLFMKMGWKIELIRNNTDLFMLAEMEEVRNKVYQMYISGK
jgi:hypothetical protein